MKNYNNYREVALRVAKTKEKPKDNWLKEVKITFSHSESSQKKSCPKSAFLGLCEAGLVKDIPTKNYTTSVDNKTYAIEAINILKRNLDTSFSPKELWQKVKELLFIDKKDHNSQMHVVLALWENNLINY